MTVDITSGRKAADKVIGRKEILMKKIAEVMLHVHLEIEDFIFTAGMIPTTILIPIVTNNTVSRMLN